MSISSMLLPEFDQEMATTRKVLERIPADKFTWKPHETSLELGKLATHVATLNDWMSKTLELDAFDLAPLDGEPYRLPEITTPEEVLERFDQFAAAARSALAAASDEHLLAPWSLQQGGQTIFTMPRLVSIRSFILNHLIHHRGQLSVYLRMNAIPVPSIYGPSADEGAF